jgi:hypothetical protein
MDCHHCFDRPRGNGERIRAAGGQQRQGEAGPPILPADDCVYSLTFSCTTVYDLPSLFCRAQVLETVDRTLGQLEGLLSKEGGASQMLSQAEFDQTSENVHLLLSRI